MKLILHILAEQIYALAHASWAKQIVGRYSKNSRSHPENPVLWWSEVVSENPLGSLSVPWLCFDGHDRLNDDSTDPVI